MYLVFFNYPNLLLTQTIQPINQPINLLFKLSRIKPFILFFNNLIKQLHNLLWYLSECCVVAKKVSKKTNPCRIRSIAFVVYIYFSFLGKTNILKKIKLPLTKL